MKNKTTYNEQQTDPWSDFEKVKKHLEIPYAKTKAEVWAEMESKLVALPIAQKTNLFARTYFRLAVAALLVLMLGIAGLIRFYTVTVETLPGQHQLVDLPDGSMIHLNAGSFLKYHPYSWRFSRTLSFQGEGFFEVAKGTPFMVLSENGKTRVVGTSFTIYSRDEFYRVACLTGKVSVTDDKNRHEVLLEPNQKAELNRNGEFDIQQNINLTTATAWIDNKFVFTSAPFTEVLNEIERQYDVTILWKKEMDLSYKYTGNFNRDQSIEQVLGFVCRPFGIQFEKIKANEFLLKKTGN
ncbi:MAG TPA: FecR domain-containing protein [Prolixibacteraceae bacterium]|nr:FecR domain-containing protein [Prolixibacteraceae bacterium]